MPSNFVRKEIYHIEEILPSIKVISDGNRYPKINLHGDLMDLSNKRLRIFKRDGVTCCQCGIEGLYFAKEAQIITPEAWNINLYALNEKGEDILMTKDHIIPVSRGGSDALENLRVMCFPCNNKRGNEHNSKYTVIKNNKRMWIFDPETQKKIYTPPDFLRIFVQRRDLEHLAGYLEEFDRISAIFVFEAKMLHRLMRKKGKFIPNRVVPTGFRRRNDKLD